MAREAALVFEQIASTPLRADPERALRLAELACSAQPAFYRIVPADRAEILKAVAAQIAEPGFDMAHTFVLRDREDVALITAVSLQLLASARMAAMAALLKLVPGSERKGFVARMRDYSAGIEPVEDTGHYVSRVAVVPERQGRGLGREALSGYLAQLGPMRVHLHVHRDNAPAIAVYRSLGYLPRSDAKYLFPAFTRRP